MIINSILKQKSRALRKKGFSYGEIASKIKISKSTVKYWCTDIILNQKDQKRLYTKQIKALSGGPRSSHNRRQKEIEKITKNSEKEISLPINLDTYKLFGAALYWAEGNKISDFTITNSDPLLIQFMCQWFCKIFNVTPNDLKAHLNIYPQQNDLEIKKFWSNITGIPLNRFGKTFIKPVSKNYKKNNLYYGTIKVRVSKGTDFRHRVFSWINAILKNNKINVGITERKWYKLKGDYMRP
ncbi:MAG: hypothetical protein WC657_01690 [Candidatus Paceibacterota bacterium]|jgi:hypothetical protein